MFTSIHWIKIVKHLLVIITCHALKIATMWISKYSSNLDNKFICVLFCGCVISSFPTKVIFLKLCSMNVQPLVSDSVSLILRHTFKTFILILVLYPYCSLMSVISLVCWNNVFCMEIYAWLQLFYIFLFIFSNPWYSFLDFFSLNVIYVYKYTCLAYQKRLIKAIEDANNIGLLKLFDTEARQLVKRISWLKDISYAKNKEKRFLSCDV